MSEAPAGRPEAAAAIWDWRAETQNAAAASAAKARVRGALQALLAIGVGTLVFLFGSRPVGTVILTIASVILVAALVSPTGLFRGIERVFLVLGGALGQVLLAAAFYLFFLPFGLLFRRGRNDWMRRFYEQDATTYWDSPDTVRTTSKSRERLY